MRKITPVIIITLLASCSSFDFFMRDITIARSKNILIGFFERRNMNFDPFMIRNFRDTLAFEFFKYGYASELLTNDGDTGGRNRFSNISRKQIQKLCSDNGSDLFIQGAMSETEIGDFADKDISTLVTFLIYDAKGEKIGEAHYSTSDTLSKVNTMKKVVDVFASRLHSAITSH